MPQVVITADDLGRRHGPDGNVRHVAFKTRELHRLLVSLLIEGFLLISDLHEPSLLRRLIAIDNRQRPVALQVQRLLITHRPVAPVLPPYPPRMRMLLRRPDGFASDLHPVRVESLHTLRGDRVDDLSVFGVLAIPPKMCGQIVWGFRLPGPD